MRMTSSFSPSNVFFLDRLTLYLLCCLLAVVPTTLRADEQTALSGQFFSCQFLS
jgi:hypothetical protein